MQQQRILLTTLNAKYIHMNLAIRLLYELNKSDERLSWKEFTIKEDQQEIANFCAQFEVVCFSCYIWNITQTLAVSKLIKALNPNTKILLGGPEVTYDWKDVIQFPSIDFVVTHLFSIRIGSSIHTYWRYPSATDNTSANNAILVFAEWTEMSTTQIGQ